MNCERIQQEILLSQTGELSEQAFNEVKKHIASCESCRKYSEETLKIISMAGSYLPSEGPGPEVMAKILAAAREETDRKVVFFQWSSGRLAACAAAAALLILGAGLWLFKAPPLNSVSHMSAIVMAVGAEENLQVISQSGKTEKDHELQALASRLLIIEGFVADEMPELEVSDEVDELLPTALLWHSIDVFELQKCV